jgi:RNA polymerase sigma factor (sigma-70 family)
LEDRQLVAAVRDGDERGFECLFARYRAPINAYVATMVKDRGHSEDLTQEIFISALRSMRSAEQPVVFKPWLYRIARNACIDSHRRSGRGGAEIPAAGAERRLESDPPRLVAAAPRPQDVVAARERFDGLYRALAQLPRVDRSLIVLREFEGRSYREIVERSGLTAPAVESALFRARRRLRECYEQMLDGRSRDHPAAEPAPLVARRPRRVLGGLPCDRGRPLEGAASPG